MRPKEERGGRGAFSPGDMIAGRYVVEKVLGEGSMGIVYQCLDKVGGVSVAVKCLPPEVSRNADEMEDIRANYRLVADLHHPNIAGARTLEVDSSTGDYYLVMDLARGMSLKRWMRRNPQATTEAKLAILRQVAAALDYAHAQKVIHRDVKPENVMVDEEGGVKVLDFGLAAQIRSSQSRTSAAVTSRGGTPGYKSPEQWRGKPQREPADVYSFGVMAYWMFAGALPFDGDDPVVLGHAVLTEPVEPVKGLPESMNAALVKALAKQPEERFASCGAVVDALEGKGFSRVEHVERVDGGNGRARSPSGPQSGGPRSVSAAKGLLAAALLAALAGGGWWFVNSRAARSTGTTGVPPVVTNAPTGTTGVSPVATNAPTGTTGVPPVATEADVTEIAVEATVQEARVERIDDADRFKERKIALADCLNRATANRSERRWAEAAQGFTNYVEECKALLALDQERHAAKKSKTESESAKARASEAEASQYAKPRWDAASALVEEANSMFGKMAFADATSKYAAAARQFGLCVGEANAERKRQEEEAAAKAKAEQEKREREAAEAKARAEREAPRNGECRTMTLPGGVKMEMIYVAPGSFMMGSPESEEGRFDNESQHRVTLTKGYWIGKYPVAQSQWKALVSANGVSFEKGEPTPYFSRDGKVSDRVSGMDTSDFPMESVSWDDCDALVKALNRNATDGRTYSLPTEAQWEFAARGGTKSRGYTYSGGNDMDELGWYYKNSGERRLSASDWPRDLNSNRCRPHSVREKDVGNELGIVGMSGNVFEWCLDWYDKDYYTKSPTEDPCNTASGDDRVLRGGSWLNLARSCRSAYRFWNIPGYRGHYCGFRLSCSAGPREGGAEQ